MLCLGTRPEYFSAVWVKNEWSRFLKLMKKDRSKLLIPCYRDMDAYELPEEFAHLQAQDMSKIGFINDLIRGIRKVISKEAEIPTNKETTVESGNGTNTAPLLRRAFMFLEDGDWKRADEFCEQVLNLEPENAQAYVGKLMARLKVNKQEALVNCDVPFDKNSNYLKAVRFASPELKDELEGYVRSIKARNETKRLNNIYAEAQKKYETAKTEEEYKEAAAIFQSITEWKDSAGKVADALDEAEEARRQSLYEEAVHQADLNQIERYKEAIRLLENLRGWKDSNEKISEYESAIRELRAEKERFEEERRAEVAKKKKRRFKIAVILTILVESAVLTVYVVMNVIIPNNHYSEAEKLLSAGDYDGAIAKFTELGNYKDAADRVKEVRYAKAEDMFSAGDYDGAIAAFAELGDYKDASVRADEAEEVKREADLAERYQNADNLIAAGDYDGAIAIFEELGGYKDSSAKIREAKDLIYGEAETLKDKGEIAKAALTYGKLGDYSDAREQSFILWDQIACRNTIAAGYEHTVGLKTDGTVVATGDNSEGQCDVSDWEDIVAVAADSSHTIGLRSDGTVVATGENTEGQCDVSDWTDIVAIATSSLSTVGLKSDGTVVAVGENEEGQDVSDWNDIVAIAAGTWHTVGLKLDGTVIAVGKGSSGACNVSDWDDIVAIAANYGYTTGLKSDGTVVAVGDKYSDDRCDVSDWRNIIAIATGFYNMVGLKSDGTIIVRGGGRIGGDWQNIVAIAAGGLHIAGLKSDGTVVDIAAAYAAPQHVSTWSGIRLPK